VLLPGPGPKISLRAPQRDPSHRLDINRQQIVMERLNVPATPILGQELTNSRCQGTRLRTNWFATNGARYPAISPNVCGLPIPNPSYEATLQSLASCQDCSPSVRGIPLVFCCHKFFVREIFPFQNSSTYYVPVSFSTCMCLSFQQYWQLLHLSVKCRYCCQFLPNLLAIFQSGITRPDTFSLKISTCNDHNSLFFWLEITAIEND